MQRSKEFAKDFKELPFHDVEKRRYAQISNPTASSFEPGHPPTKILARQKGDHMNREAHYLKEYFMKNSPPYDWGLRSSLEDGYFFKSSCWQSATANKEDKG